MTQYKVALWPSRYVAAPVAEIDVEASSALVAANHAMAANHTPAMGIVVVMSATQQETFWDAELRGEYLAFSKTEVAPRQTDKPFIWKAESESESKPYANQSELE